MRDSGKTLAGQVLPTYLGRSSTLRKLELHYLQSKPCSETLYYFPRSESLRSCGFFVCLHPEKYVGREAHSFTIIREV